MSKIKITEEMKNEINKLTAKSLSHQEMLDFMDKYEGKRFLTENEIERARLAYKEKRRLIIRVGECDNLGRKSIEAAVHNYIKFKTVDEFVDAILNLCGYEYYFVE